MKKQIHILEGLLILTITLIASLFTIKFIYDINNEKINPETLWNLEFNNLKVTEGSETATINLDNDIIYLDLKLKEENQFYEFTIDVINNGVLKAQLSEIKLEIDNPKNILTYNISYIDDSTIEKGDIILPNSKNTIKVRIDYPKQQEKIYEELKLSLSLNVKYIAIK